jgi:hypothetical protein
LLSLSNRWYYPAFALTMLFFVLAFVPRKTIQKLFWFSLIWGVGLDTALILLFKALNFYYYVNAEPFEYLGSPFFINLSWAPAVILFFHFLPARTERFVLPVYIACYALLGTYIGVFLTNAGLIVDVNWNGLYRFPVVYLCFYACHKHYQYLKANDPDSI